MRLTVASCKSKARACHVARVALALALASCSSAPTSVPMATEAAPAVDWGPPPFDPTPVGWAAVPDMGLETTTGGDGGEVVEVATTVDFAAQAKLAGPRIILVNGVIGEGTRVSITANHTVIGLPGAEFHGGLKISGAANVVVRNLKIVGNNCTDSPDDCSGGADALSISDGAHHVWVDHCDISDGSDGNLDVNDASDYVTVSWTKFSYSGSRPGGHQFSNLVGSGDDSPGDIGHLRVSYHHDWWADRVRERMPRVRYGQVHVFNSFYSAHGDNYCVGVGVFANVLTEANVFFQVRDPIESSSYSNDQSVVVSRDNLYVGAAGAMADRGTDVFVPPYAYALDDVHEVQGRIENGAGPCPSRFVFSAMPVPSCSAPEQAAVSTP
jgi:pectate lyase